MLFNSLDFAVFLPVVFLLYWFVARKKLTYQNLLVVAASYVFYGWWDYRFLSLIIFSTVLDYSLALRLKKTNKTSQRKLLLWSSVLVNLGFLGIFKYYNFFVDNFITAFTLLGSPIQANTLNIILPVGISFYTFQTLSYTIDVYRRKLEPTTNFIAFSAFVCFFPQLVAGPIERATNFLPQFYKKRIFSNNLATDGLRQMLWGFFKKMVIADNCAIFANEIFENSADLSGSILFLGALFFTFQIYGDFSGYSDIAIGTSRLFGFDLKRNFAYPYFSRDIAEFWRRWHISLSTWFRDYLYIPLGGSKVGTWMQIRNIFIIFIVSGFWHGANWTFIIWGALNALYFLPLLLLKKNRANIEIVANNSYLPSLREFAGILLTFLLTMIAWVFFRAENLTQAIHFLNNMFSADLLSIPEYAFRKRIYPILSLLMFFISIEWFGRRDQYAIATIKKKIIFPLRWTFYAFIVFLIGMFMQTEETPFIYFQF